MSVTLGLTVHVLVFWHVLLRIVRSMTTHSMSQPNVNPRNEVWLALLHRRKGGYAGLSLREVSQQTPWHDRKLKQLLLARSVLFNRARTGTTESEVLAPCLVGSVPQGESSVAQCL